MRTLRHHLLSFLALLMLSVSAMAQIHEAGTGVPGPVQTPHLTAELIADSGTISPGGTSHVALSLKLEPGWHVYWVYAGDSGEAPSVTWFAPQGIVLGPMQYPAPSRLPLGPLMDYGYEGTAIFPFSLTASQTTLSRHDVAEGARAMAGVPGDMPSRQGVSRAESEGRTDGAFDNESTDRRGAPC